MPDLCVSVGVCARFQSNPTELHHKAVKRIMKYVARTLDFRIWFSYDSNHTLVGFSDVNWAGCLDNRKSTSRGCFFLGNNLITCIERNKIQFHSPQSKLNISMQGVVAHMFFG